MLSLLGVQVHQVLHRGNIGHELCQMYMEVTGLQSSSSFSQYSFLALAAPTRARSYARHTVNFGELDPV